MVVTDRVLMGPGPCNPYPEATAGLTRPMLGHLDPEFLALLDETCENLRTVWGTANALTLPVSGTGSAGMEAAFVNTVGPGDVVVVGVNGLFGERMCDVAGRCGAEVVRVDTPWGQPLDPEAVLSALVLADCVTSLGGIPVAIDDWDVDLAYSGTQKCLGVSPGLAPFTLGPRAWERRIPTPQSWYLDLGMIGAYTSGTARKYHHTAPIAMITSLHAALGALLDEGLQGSWDRHAECGAALQDGLEKLGFELWAAAGHRLPQLTTVLVPDGVDDAAVRRALLTRYGIEIGGGVGPWAGKVWRIGCMGHTARLRNVTLLLAALSETLSR
jgi:alanine-glyoxylate transaminase/serine-glyoxylate transaminase/serine-pyruvate transaminase